MDQTNDPVLCDLLVIGSGAAGLAAAVTAAHHGLKVVVAEKETQFGGTTAWSGGWIWAPRNPLARRAGIDEDISSPRSYLAALLGNKFNAERVEAFLRAAPDMVAFFQDHTALQFESGTHIPDTYGHLKGAGTGGRSVIAAPFDGRELGAAIALLKPPLRETTFMGMTIQAGADLRAFMTMTRSPRAFVYVARRFGRHLLDLAMYGRGYQLRNGNALIARLIRSALDLGVDLRANSPVETLVQEQGTVVGATLRTTAGPIDVRAKQGVLPATGGFAHDSRRIVGLLPDAEHHQSLATPSATGDGARMGEAAGGSVDVSLAAPAAYCPVSLVPYRDGTMGRFPHIIERGKPGIIGVLRDGRRFCNEGEGYHDYVTAMLAAVPEREEVASWLICTRRFQRRYGLGISRPSPVPVGPWIRSGYIKSGRTPAELAAACGIDAAGLERTLADYNRHAVRGEDPAFGRGTTPYHRLQGDASHLPNPCVAPITDGPFYAVKVIPGSFSLFAGLNTDHYARVLTHAGSPVPGLFAAGADMASVMGGYYPAGGINLGPAMTFGYIAGLYVSGDHDQ